MVATNNFLESLVRLHGLLPWQLQEIPLVKTFKAVRKAFGCPFILNL